MYSNFVHATNDASHYTKPPTCSTDVHLTTLTLFTRAVKISKFQKSKMTAVAILNKNSSGDETANVNFFYDDIVHVEASAYAH